MWAMGTSTHVIMYDPNDDLQVKRTNQLNDEIVDYALRVGGTCTGEHGVGIGKQKFQRKEHGEAINIMVGVKNMLDPNHILNPGKVLPIGLMDEK